MVRPRRVRSRDWDRFAPRVLVASFEVDDLNGKMGPQGSAEQPFAENKPVLVFAPGCCPRPKPRTELTPLHLPSPGIDTERLFQRVLAGGKLSDVRRPASIAAESLIVCDWREATAGLCTACSGSYLRLGRLTERGW